jgi:hypothetical protein
LKDLELLQLIRLHKKKKDPTLATNYTEKYKGAMTKQPINEIDYQLKELRKGWE